MITDIFKQNDLRYNNETEFHIPYGVTIIESLAFANNSYVKKVIIPDTVEAYGHNIFQSSTIEEVVFPEKINVIPVGFFSDCNNITTFTIPRQIKQIGERAFSGCTNLKEINFQEGLESIGKSSFLSCYSLKQVILPKSLTCINYAAFSFCKNLKKVKFRGGRNYKKILSKVFSDCYSLENIELPRSLRRLYMDAFTNCNSLKTVTIPPYLSDIERPYQISKWANVRFHVDLQNKEYTSKNGCLYSKDLKRMLTYYDNGSPTFEVLPSVDTLTSHIFSNTKFLKKLVLSDNLVSTGAFFAENSSIEEIEFPKNLKRLKEGSFNNCEKLKEITFKSDDIFIEQKSFNNCSNLEVVEFFGKQASYSKYSFENTYNKHIDQRVISHQKISLDTTGNFNDTEPSKDKIFNHVILQQNYSTNIFEWLSDNILA